MVEKPASNAAFPGLGGSTSQAEILQTLIDIGQVITTSHSLEETLAQIVALVARRMEVDVCSLYLLDETTQELVLKATHGLSQSAVGMVRMPLKEGLIGLVAETGRPVNLTDVNKHPRYKYFPHIDEEKLSSLCGVPLIEFRKILGVLIIQNQESRLFSPDEENLLVTISSQITGLISKAMLVDRMQRETQEPEGPTPRKKKKKSLRWEGRPVAPGVAQGKPILLRRGMTGEPDPAPLGSPEQELADLERAIRASEQEILELIRDVTQRLGEADAAIFHSHLLFLEDRGFIRKISDRINQGVSAPWAVNRVVRDYLATFQRLSDPYLRERGADLEDVGHRLLRHLGHGGALAGQEMQEGILVADMLTPSDTARLDPTRVKGIVTRLGGYVSHAAILARSLRIPAVTGVDNPLSLVGNETLLVDGQQGLVLINPDAHVVKEYARYQDTRGKYLDHLDGLRNVSCATQDGMPVTLMGNVGLDNDLADCQRYGAEGIGLFRTEVQYLMHTRRPTVDEMAQFYIRAMESSAGKPVVFRTLDFGGERYPSYLNFPREDNPFLGLRSIRYQLQNVQLLRDQFQALLMAAEKGDCRIMFPLISQVDELFLAKRIFQEERERMRAETGREAPNPKLGMLFEVPSSVMMADLYAEELDFMSIGSNDLTQYTLGVDRNNPFVNHLYDPLEPAVLRLIQWLVDVGRRHDKPVELCGELASDTEGCVVLVGLGLRQLSMHAPLIPLVKDLLSQITMQQAQQVAQMALSSTSAAVVRRNIRMMINPLGR
ncbi:MAG: phosphoenolpyruvate--protein phosphotransferase [Deltaproteobacteria bacterium]|nr:phosphoenolpyruvate--protein phosphotransferase [Deltaproteobacteria bacterium]